MSGIGTESVEDIKEGLRTIQQVIEANEYDDEFDEDAFDENGNYIGG